MELLLIRHCASSGQAPEAPLSADGVMQAERLANALSGFGTDAIYSSPFARAVASVEPMARRLALPISTDDRLRERLLSLMPEPDWLAHLHRSFDDFSYRVGGGENLHEAQARGLAAIAGIAAQSHRLAAVASHGNLLAAILAAADPDFGFERWRAMSNPDVYRLRMDGDAPVAFRRVEFPSGPLAAP